MTLDNLAKIGRLKAHAASKEEIADLLAAARRNLGDAHASNISTENRFDAAYKCILQAALIGLMAQGFRPDTKSPGHHATVIQSLPKTIGIDAQRVVVLDVLRNKRNLSDYTGKPIDPGSLASCMAEAEQLLEDTSLWLAACHPQLKP
jgi:hypothetical protein